MRKDGKWRESVSRKKRRKKVRRKERKDKKINGGKMTTILSP